MSTVASQIRGMSHIALELSSLKAGERFLVEILGCKEQFRTTFEGFELVMLKAGPVRIEMWQRREPAETTEGHTPSTIHHIAFGVRNLDRAMEGARNMGLAVLQEPYAPTDGIREAIIEGPDGLRIQLAEQNIAKLIWRNRRGD